jgi:predicted ATP-grasp superfamily ATP-dependent carboligase
MEINLDLLSIQISMEAENWNEMSEKVITYLREKKTQNIGSANAEENFAALA